MEDWVKQYKTMLLGIAFILFGIACRVMIIGRINTGILEDIGIYLPFIGIIIVLVGYFRKENPPK